MPRGSFGLDIGCGLGSHTILLAKEVAPNGSVIGIDTNSEFIKYAIDQLQDTDLIGNVKYQTADADNLPFKENSRDWIWSVDTLWPDNNFEKRISEILRVLKPGGKIALALWSSQLLLPGYPNIEAALNISSAGLAPFKKDSSPEQHFLLTGKQLQLAGFKNIIVRSFIGEIQTPLDMKMKEAALSLILMRWEGANREVAQETWEIFEKLTDPNSPQYILNSKDYYAFFTYTLFCGIKR